MNMPQMFPTTKFIEILRIKVRYSFAHPRFDLFYTVDGGIGRRSVNRGAVRGGGRMTVFRN